MTDPQFELYMQHLERLSEADRRKATRIGRLYAPAPLPEPDHQRDTQTHQYNDEWSTE